MMLTERKIWYSVQNMGDGSAYPMFFDTEELAEWDQAHEAESWGESCVDNLTIETDGQYIGSPDVKDAVSYWLYRTGDEDFEPWDLRDEYLQAFFPDGLPTFEVWISGDTTVGEYYDIFVNGELKDRKFGWDRNTRENVTTEKGRAALEERLNAVHSTG